MRQLKAMLAALMTALVVLTLPGCAREIVRDRPTIVRVPVAQACAGTRPIAVSPLRVTVPAEVWAAFDLVQKTAVVARQGLARQGYAEQLEAATAACP